MNRNKLFSFLSMTVLIVLVVSLFSTVNVLADEGTPPPPTEESVQPTEEGSVTETEAAPVSTPEPELVEESTPTAEAESIEEASPTPEPETVSEMLESAPEGMDVVVMDENGEPLALATEEAVQVILGGDPMWCPDGITPGTDSLNECTPSYTDFWQLVDDLADGGYSGNGTIYVAWDYADTEGNIYIDHTNGFISDLDDLVVQGGWDFISDTYYNNDVTYQSNLGNNALNIENWIGNIIINNILIDSPDSTGVYVDTTGDVELNYVSVSNGDYEGADIEAGGDVDVNHSEFTGNGYVGYSGPGFSYPSEGFNIVAGGDVTLFDVISNYNAGAGVAIYTPTGDVEVTQGEFNENGWGTGFGAEVYSSVTLPDFFSYSGQIFGGEGLYVEAGGDISLLDVEASLNASDGAYLFGSGEISVTNGTFNNNGGLGYTGVTVSYSDLGGGDISVGFTLGQYLGSGLIASTSGGGITLENVYADSNANDGANLTASGDILVTNSEFSANGWGNSNGTDTYDFFDDYCDDGPCGYDLMYEYLISNGGGAFCELISGFDANIFNPCVDYASLVVQSPNFSYQVNRSEGTGWYENGYVLDQYGGSGLYATSLTGSITLDNVDAFSNGGNGANLLSQTGVAISNSNFDDNGYLGFSYNTETLYEDTLLGEYQDGGDLEFVYGDGLVADSAGDITLTTIVANGNAYYGANIFSEGLVQVENAEFSSNGVFVPAGGTYALFDDYLYDLFGIDTAVEFPVSGYYFGFGNVETAVSSSSVAFSDFGSGSGLFADGLAGISLTDVTADNNLGFGADIFTLGTMDVTTSGFNGNGEGFFGSFYVSKDDDSFYEEYYAQNGSGLWGYADGNITLSDVTANANTLHGGEIYSDNSTSINIEYSDFGGNGFGGISLQSEIYKSGAYLEYSYLEEYGSGLYVDATGNFLLTEVTANGNFKNGAEIHAHGGTVYVVCGQYDNNGQYGIHETGASLLGLFGPEILGNGMPKQYYFSNLLAISNECAIPDVIVPLDFSVPAKDGLAPCENVDFALFILENGDFVAFPCPIRDAAFVRTQPEEELPAPLPDKKPFEAGGEYLYLSALRTTLLRGGKSLGMNEIPVLVSFLMPQGAFEGNLAVLYWDGEWVELTGEVTDIGPLGLVENGKFYYQVYSEYIGTFVLVSK